ncbi:MJ0042-type zinc finger domain-containing protein [Humisphaera borealis]|uniref:Uncharacterized protein n=1 Tax=Humisphaera borealis TaxID=2807512 RepID=A0A7M2WZD5_9BACT|nr:MJ0042-type zinc finger domain-containing protein [Humisphaera borealis]QOV90846.1 hypothetical protein IPV69_05665 [Humisphaera borealis]
MPLLVQCVNCQRRYSLDEKSAGKKVKCKECGTVFVAQAAGQSAGLTSAPPASPPPAAPRVAPRTAAPTIQTPPPRPRMEENDDPFAAMSLLEAGTAPPPETSGPMYSGAAMSVRQAPAAPATPYTFAPPPRKRTNTTKSLGLDSLTPILLLCFFVGLAVVLYMGLTHVTDKAEPGTHPLEIKAAKNAVWIMVITFAVSHFVIVAPLVLLAVFIASKIMKFELPGAGYMRAAGVGALPLVVLLGSDILLPANMALRLILLVSILALAFYALKNIFELMIGEALVAYGFTCVFFVVGIVVSITMSGIVAAAGIVQSTADAQRAINAEQEQKRDQELADLRGSRPPGYRPSGTPSSGGGATEPPPPPVDPMETRAQSLQRRLEAFDARNLDNAGRESVERDFATLRAEVASATGPLRARPEWGSIDQLHKSILQKINALPTEQPDPQIFKPVVADTEFAPPANGVAALGEEVSFGKYFIRPAADARMDLRTSNPSRYQWTAGQSRGESFSLSSVPRKNDRQLRPWLLTRPFQRTAAERDGLYYVEANANAKSTYGTLGGLPATKLEGESALGQRFVEYILLDGSNWIVMRSQSRGDDLQAYDLFDLSARTLRPQRAGEPPVDPFAPERVADRIGEDAEAVSAILRKNPVVAEPIVIRLLSSADMRTRRAAADLLPFVISDKGLPQVESMASHADDHVAGAVRALLKKMKPGAFDEVAEVLLDMKGTDTFKRKAAFERLAKMSPPNDKRRNEVATILEDTIIQEKGFGFEAEAAANALAAWPGDKTSARLAPLLNDPKLFPSRRDNLLTAISGSKDKLTVNIVMKWMPLAPEKVTPILIRMGPIAEDEAIRQLNIYFTNNTEDGPKVRAGCVAILTEVGSMKSMEVLGRASRDKRDVVTQEAAKQAIDNIKARTAKPATKPG